MVRRSDAELVFPIQTGCQTVKTRGIYALAVSTLFTIAACTTSDLRKGNVALELGDYVMAINFFSRILEKNPAHFEARLGMGKALLQQAIDNSGDTVSWRMAVMHLEAARTLNGSSEAPKLLAQVWAERASGLLHAADTVAALEMLTKAIASDPQSAEPLNLAGIIYFRTGRPEKARILFERAAAADTSNPSLLFNLGMLHWEEKRIKEAYDLWLRALKKSPDDEDFLYWFAAAEKRLRDTTRHIHKAEDIVR